MTKGFLILIFVGILGIYFVKNLVGQIQEEDATYQTTELKMQKEDQAYYRTDSSGRLILDVSKLDATKQYQLWGRSNFKQQLVGMIPEFEEMKEFTQEVIYGSPLREDILRSIETMKKGLLSGGMTQIEAQRLLDLPQ